jgi:hypothetical protein
LGPADTVVDATAANIKFPLDLGEPPGEVVR